MQNLELTKTKDGKTAVQCSQLYKALGLAETIHYIQLTLNFTD